MLSDPRGYKDDLGKNEYRLDGYIVSLIVAPEEKIHHVHRNILCAHSPFFETAFKKDWVEGRTGSMPLAGDDPKIVELYLHCLFRDKIFSR